MSHVEQRFDGQVLTIALGERIDVGNAAEVQAELLSVCAEHPNAPVVLDGSGLTYISSAGLRVMLRLKKTVGELKVIDLAPSVYEVFSATGFTALMDVRKAFREVSVEGCTIIGQGAESVLYRINDEVVCKVARNSESLDDIDRERELSREVFVAGIPTALSYEVVRVGNGYGSLFELLNAKTVAKLLDSGAWDVDRAARESAKLMTQMAQTELAAVSLPSARERVLDWTYPLEAVLDEGTFTRLRELVEAIPDDSHMVHGDFHMNNVMVQDDEPLLIDMDKLSHGNAIIDLGITFSTHVGRGMLNRPLSESFLGIDWDLSCRLWKLMLRYRFPEASDEELRLIEDKARIIGASRLMERPLHHKDIDEELAQKTYALYGGIIKESLARVDSLAL